MGRVPGGIANFRVLVSAIKQTDRRVILAGVFDRRGLLDPFLDGFPLFVQLFKDRQSQRVGAVTIIRPPFTQFLWIERGLRAVDRRAVKPRGFARDWIAAVGVSHIVVESKPQRGATAGRAAGGADAF